jgi:lysozyme
LFWPFVSRLAYLSPEPMTRLTRVSPHSLARFGWLAALALALAGCGGGGGPAMLDFDDGYPKPTDYPIHGIDVSKYQGTIDWNAVAGSGVKFVWIKATEGGDHVDERFQANWQGAKLAGIPHGAYHFMYWCRKPIEEATWFEENVPVEADALPPVLDVEPTPDSRTCRRHLERDQTVADMKVVLEEMERHFGKRPVIYTSIDFYRSILGGGAFTDYPIWVRSTKHNPTLPYGGRDWKFWQYRADGTVSGIDGYVDRNVFYGDHDQWQAFLDGPRPAAPATAAVAQPSTQAALAPPQTIDDGRPADSN